jgi:hypothetical protein
MRQTVASPNESFSHDSFLFVVSLLLLCLQNRFVREDSDVVRPFLRVLIGQIKKRSIVFHCLRVISSNS